MSGNRTLSVSILKQGIWELSCDKSHASHFSLEILRALLEALRNGPPEVQVMALAAAWNMSVVADVRLALVQVSFSYLDRSDNNLISGSKAIKVSLLGCCHKACLAGSERGKSCVTPQ
jgi:pantothenate kinase type III